jgi:hypothetical protein
LLTNLATAYVMGQFWPVLIAAIPFALIHTLSNVAIFVILTPVLLKLSTMLRIQEEFPNYKTIRAGQP